MEFVWHHIHHNVYKCRAGICKRRWIGEETCTLLDVTLVRNSCGYHLQAHAVQQLSFVDILGQLRPSWQAAHSRLPQHHIQILEAKKSHGSRARNKDLNTALKCAMLFHNFVPGHIVPFFSMYFLWSVRGVSDIRSHEVHRVRQIYANIHIRIYIYTYIHIHTYILYVLFPYACPLVPRINGALASNVNEVLPTATVTVCHRTQRQCSTVRRTPKELKLFSAKLLVQGLTST